METHKPSDTLAPGHILRGHGATYAIVRVLGQGSFGITYLARTVVDADEIEQMLCVKEFFMRDVNGRTGTSVTNSSREGMFTYYRHKFEQEAAHLGRLRHPCIVRVTDAFRANGTSYYAMQYVDGLSLDGYIAKKGRLTLQQTAELARQIGDALHFMHSRGMVHLDVKPSNVMLTAEGKAALVDFGLSKQYDSGGQPESSTTVGGGTPGYAPIEQASHRQGKGVPVQMDVYALGATVFKMLTGRRPPEAAHILNQGFPLAEMRQCGVPAPVVGVVRKAMAPLCADRYKSVAQFCSALEKAIEQEDEATLELTERTSFEPSALAGGRASCNTSLVSSSRSESPLMCPDGEGPKGFHMFVVAIAFCVTGALSCLPDFFIGGYDHMVCVTIVGQCASWAYNLLHGTATDDMFPLLLAGVPSGVGAVVAVWWKRRRLSQMSASQMFWQVIRWMAYCLTFNAVASVAIRQNLFDEYSLFAWQCCLFAVQLALVIVATYLVLRWLRRV